MKRLSIYLVGICCVMQLAWAQSITVESQEYCGGETVTLTSSDAGCANYVWYADNGNELATGCSYTTLTLVGDHYFSVVDPSATSTSTIGYSINSAGLSTAQIAGWTNPDIQLTTYFDVNSTVTINSVDVRYQGYTWDPGSTPLSFVIYTAAGVEVTSVTPTLANTGSNVDTDVTINFNQVLTPGSYYISIENSGVGSAFNNQVYLNQSGADYSGGGALDYGGIHISSNGGGAYYGGLYDWSVEMTEQVSVSVVDTCIQTGTGVCADRGNPLVSIDFGSGDNPGPELPVGFTTYTYIDPTSGPGITDGQYSLLNNPQVGHGNNIIGWMDGSDHTSGEPNDDGFFMLVNAALAPGEFYRGEVDGLCDNTNYVFSAWLANPQEAWRCAGWGEVAVYPDVTFQIEDSLGNILMQQSTGQLSEESSIVWNNYEYEFTLAAGHNKVQLVLINNGPGGCGNDILIDDITFSPCTPAPTILTNDDLPACRFSELTLETILPDALTTATLQWYESIDGGNTFEELSGASEETYVTELTEDSIRYQLSATVPSGNGIDCPAWSNILAIPTKLCPYVEYEGISPNGDGLNDYWHVDYIDIYPENTVKIYNRWGNLVWQAEGYDNNTIKWDGTSNAGLTTGNVLPAGTYYYVISAIVEGEEDTRQGIVIIH